MDNLPTPSDNQRIGMYYLPDSNHYTQQDLEKWLPALRSIGAQWITLEAQVRKAIPENFIRGVIEAGIEPILQFGLNSECLVCVDDIGGMLDAYANWGVHYISPFRAPNVKVNWSSTGWAEKDLVGRFIQSFLPIGERIISAELIPVFPALVPGGDYWDTSFLRTALELIANHQSEIGEKMVLGLHAWAGGRNIDWGAGGPERWPQAKPYFTPEDSEDHMGVRIFDWYKVIAEAAVGRCLPMMVLAGGSAPGKGMHETEEELSPNDADKNREIAKMMQTMGSSENDLDAVPEEVLNFNFWVLNEGDLNEEAERAWFMYDAKPKASAEALIEWKEEAEKQSYEAKRVISKTELYAKPESPMRSFEHYLLLPTYEWGVAEWHLDVIRPFVKKHQPTVGYSIDEAAYAAKVTVVGGESSFSKEMIDGLLSKGCVVEQIEGDGTKIASQLMTL